MFLGTRRIARPCPGLIQRLRGSRQYSEGTFGLLAGITLDDLPGNGIESKLSAHENESTAPDSL
jgi:hypothetical protein